MPPRSAILFFMNSQSDYLKKNQIKELLGFFNFVVQKFILYFAVGIISSKNKFSGSNLDFDFVSSPRIKFENVTVYMHVVDSENVNNFGSNYCFNKFQIRELLEPFQLFGAKVYER